MTQHETITGRDLHSLVGTTAAAATVPMGDSEAAAQAATGDVTVLMTDHGSAISVTADPPVALRDALRKRSRRPGIAAGAGPLAAAWRPISAPAARSARPPGRYSGLWEESRVDKEANSPVLLELPSQLEGFGLVTEVRRRRDSGQVYRVRSAY
ncbi:hypothetical protein AB0I22_37965 [Streptomyces sp. NPDC050610]|uniref:hypothetical protein n=1 Tax=Streptomyces sp. NPDC050610 TaxID=3157097 RepID=UPI003426E2E0